MKLNSFLFLLTVPYLLSCSRFSTQDSVVDIKDPNSSESSESPITKKYCTISTQGYFSSERTPINLVCLQKDGFWKFENNFPEAEPAERTSAIYFGASLAQAENGDPLLSYIRQIKSSSSQDDLMVARYNSQNVWELVSSIPVNSLGSLSTEFYSQFGGRVFDFLESIRLLWTDSTQGYLASWNQNNWNNIAMASSSNIFLRHPEILRSTDKVLAYFYYGEPQPTVWKFDGTQLVSIGGPPIDPKIEWSLYTSLVEWNGQLVFAYTSSDYPLFKNWNVQTDITKIAVRDGIDWKIISSGIQDKPGHDGVNPFLFTMDGNLFVIYSDYSATGLPTDSQRISFRFRVKRWDGKTWVRFGTESDVINLSQRFEFLNDNGVVLVHVFQPNPNGTGSREAVLKWENGAFSYLGQPLQAFPQKSFLMSSRPGAVIRFK